MSTPVHIADWMPTLAAMLQIQPDWDTQWDGVDIWPLITDEAERPAEDRAHYWNFRHGRFFAAQHEGWKLIHVPERETPNELFHIEMDPCETRDLAADQPQRVQSLLDVLHELRRTDDSSARPRLRWTLAPAPGPAPPPRPRRSRGRRAPGP